MNSSAKLEPWLLNSIWPISGGNICHKENDTIFFRTWFSASFCGSVISRRWHTPGPLLQSGSKPVTGKAAPSSPWPLSPLSFSILHVDVETCFHVLDLHHISSGLVRTPQCVLIYLFVMYNTRLWTWNLWALQRNTTLPSPHQNKSQACRQAPGVGPHWRSLRSSRHVFPRDSFPDARTYLCVVWEHLSLSFFTTKPRHS